MMSMKQSANYLLKGILIGMGIVLGIGATAILAVTVSGTMHTFSSRDVVSASQINTNFASLRAAVETSAHANHSPPVGTIMAWHKNLTNVPALPEGWLECNGQMVTDTASVLDGVTLPDLNGQRRFLRGNATSGPLENSVFAAHTHRSPMLVRTYHAGAVFTDLGTGNTPQGIAPGIEQFYHSTNTMNPNVGIAGSGGETRPINMSVVWIIRVK